MKRTHRMLWNMSHAEFFAYAQARLTSIADELKYYDITPDKAAQLSMIDELREFLTEAEQRIVDNDNNLAEVLEDNGSFEL